MLYIWGTYFSRLVGFIYTSRTDPRVLKVARLDFWGNRVDEIFDIDDFVPLESVNCLPQDKYIQLERYSEPITNLYITFNFGVLDNLDEFERTFGPIPKCFHFYTLEQDLKKEKK